jgi:hypothetical protein
MGLDAIIYIIVFLAGFVGLIVRLANPRLKRQWANETAKRFKPAAPDAAADFAEEGAGREVEEERMGGESGPFEKPEHAPALPLPVSRVQVEHPTATSTGPGDMGSGIFGTAVQSSVEKPAVRVGGADVGRSERGWARIQSLSPLKKAIILSELLGRPKALDEDRPP